MGINRFKVSDNFSLHEFECSHCATVKLDPKIVDMVQKVRTHFGQAVYVSSGYRCPEHNKAVGGAKDSQHLYGKAADIVVRNVSPDKVAEYCEPFVDGLGRYRTFTHIDCRGYKARWDYR